MNNDELYIAHMLEAIEKIERFVGALKLDDFVKNDLLQSGVMRELGVVGEAAKKLSPAYKMSHDSIPWKEIIGMRDKLIHDYFEIDVEALWQTVNTDLPILKEKLAK